MSTPTRRRRPPKDEPLSPSVALAGDEKMTIKEVLADLKVAPATFYRWRQLGKAPRSIKLPNGDVRIRRSEYERWLAEREDAA